MRRILAALALSFLTVTAAGAEVTGVVYSDDGSVVEGAAVKAGSVATVTAKDGSFLLSGLPEGVIELDVEGTTLFALAGDDVTVHLSTNAPKEERERPTPAAAPRVRGDGTISGVVRLNGKPLANAPVVVQGLADRSIAPLRVLANAKGEYRVPGLEPLRYAVVVDERLSPRVRLPQIGPMYAEGHEPFIVDLRTAREAASNIDLVTAPMIRGRVTTADGKPVAHARIHLLLSNRPALDFALESTARTRADGRYSFPAPEWSPAESVTVAVTPPLHSTIRSKPFPLGTADRAVDITLPKLERVNLRVTDRAGKPVAGARVAFSRTADVADPGLLEHLAERGAKTNEAGELALHLAPDSYDFAVAAKEFQKATATKRIARPGNVDLVLERAASIRGRVHRAGRGVPKVHVRIVSGERTRRDAFGSTDGEGKFELSGLAPGTYRVGVFLDEQMIDRTITAEAPGNVDVALPPAGALRGRVIDAATREPVREFVFTIEATEGRAQIARGETSADGTFAATLPAGTYRVSAGAAGFTASESVEVQIVENETTALELRLGRGVVITGRVTDDTGLPVADADVMVIGREVERIRRGRGPRVAPGHTKSASDGTFSVTGVEPGEAQLMVRKAGYVPHRAAVDAQSAITVDVQLARGLTLHGIVLRGGKPVADASVSATTSAVGGDHQPAMTGRDGRFVLTGLVAARYTIGAYAGDTHAEVRDVDPARQKEITIHLDAKPRGVVYGTVTGIPDMGGRPAHRVVMVQSENGGAEGTIDDAGNYRIENAPVGRVTVSASVEGASFQMRSSVQKQVEIVAGQPARVDLEMTGHVRVSGRVTQEGKPLAGVHVGFGSFDGVSASTTTRGDGFYEIALPSPGRYSIYARADRIPERHFSTIRDIRGGETVDIDLREQVIEGTVVDAVTRLPIEGALVTLAPDMEAVTSIYTEVPTDANGRFRIVTASSGPQRLVASAPGYAHRAIPLSATSAHYAFELAPVEGLRVRVVDARSGMPLDAHVTVHDPGGTIVPGRMQRSRDGSSYAFSLAPGKYRLHVVVQGYAKKTMEITAPGTIDVRME